jgi:hypothetical protein
MFREVRPPVRRLVPLAVCRPERLMTAVLLL